ncbi:GGDEF domain-containing protein [uncultured Croceicoccus sp.]|uniref:GGDEF domain-containing protein n=1 Tax=uncultured Croceicoccus sp. TaxID=1295329 RepID=UPI002639BB4B|nr:GGDEF domain-containing protein [uncultured Croceicoccus sp.]
MPTTISVGYAHVAIYGFMAVLCVTLLLAFQRKPALAWLTASLFIATAEVLLLARLTSEGAKLLLAICCVPVAYACIGQTTRHLYAQRRTPRAFHALIAAIVAAGWAALLAGLPALVAVMMFNLACAVAVAETPWRIARARVLRPIDWALFVAVTGTGAVFVARLVLYPLLFDAHRDLAAITGSDIDRALLAVNGLLAGPIVLLLIARVVAGVIAGYRDRSERDPLTGLANRTAFERLAVQAMRGNGALILCDLDHFKQVNDRYGHSVGDAVLRRFAVLLRETGLNAARIGGEEFALIAAERGEIEATFIAENLRQRLSSSHFEAIDADHVLTASFGVAGFQPHASLQSLIDEADSALYTSKNEGRDRVTLHTPNLVREAEPQRYLAEA